MSNPFNMIAPGRGTNIWSSSAVADSMRVFKDGDMVTLAEGGIDITLDKKWEQPQLVTPGVAEPANLMYQGLYSVKGKEKTHLHPNVSLRYLQALMGSDTVAQQGTTTAYKHTFLKNDAQPNAIFPGLTITEFDDLSQFNYTGVQVQGGTFSVDPAKPIEAEWDMIGIFGGEALGTSGTSVGSAISFPITISSNTVTLTVDGGSPIIVTIPNGSYTATNLAAAINTAISSTAGLLTTFSNSEPGQRPMVACFVDSSSCLHFYSGSKGTNSSVHAASNLSALGFTSPTETSGSATPVEPSLTAYESAPIFRGHQATLTLNGDQVNYEKLTVKFTKQLKEHTVGGLQYPDQIVLSGREKVEWDIQVPYEDTTIWSKFINNTTVSLVLTIDTGVDVGSSTGYNYKIIFTTNAGKVTTEPKPDHKLGGPLPVKIHVVGFDDPTYHDLQIDVISTNTATSF